MPVKIYWTIPAKQLNKWHVKPLRLPKHLQQLTENMTNNIVNLLTKGYRQGTNGVPFFVVLFTINGQYCTVFWKVFKPKVDKLL